MVEIIKPDFRHDSNKGTLLQLVRDGWKQVNIVLYYKGVVSGGHYHRYNVECFYIVSGCVALTAWKDDEKEEYVFRTGDMFKIDKNVFHTFIYQEDSILVVLYDRGVEMGENTKDIWNE